MLIRKIINKILNFGCKVFTGISFSVYKGAISNRSFDSMSSILLWMMAGLMEKYPEFKLTGAKVAEIGAGQFVSHPVAFLLLGVRKVVSFDLYRQFNQKASILSFSQNVMSKKTFSSFVSSEHYFKTISKIQDAKFDLNNLEALGIEYKAPFDLQNYEKNDDFDLITSYTVLEHVPPRDVLSLLTKSISILKRGGKFCHYIDLEDHLNSETAPFAFLSNDNWTDRDCYLRGNRLRINDWDSLFKAISNIEYEFVRVVRREPSLLPDTMQIQSESIKKNITVTGILVVGRKC